MAPVSGETCSNASNALPIPPQKASTADPEGVSNTLFITQIAQMSIYPGTAFKLSSEYRPDDAAETGEEFTFKSDLDGSVLQAYHQIHYDYWGLTVPNADPILVPAGEEIIPGESV